ncbi:MAG: nucleoside kinase [Bacilli bacterium]|nr:nucleoside kinase [Bacilli bacterium]
MNKKIKVTFRGSEVFEFDEGTTYKDIADNFKSYFNYDILAAKVDNNIVDLSDTLKKKCNIDFFDRSSSIGNAVYARSARFILILAVRNILGNDVEVITEHSMDRGVYCSIHGAELTKDIVKKISKEMKEIVKEKYLYTKLSVSRIDAIRYFKKLKQNDKVNLLKYISNTYINLYRINDLYDYFHGKMAYSTGQINEFKLTYIKDNGFVMSLPDTTNPECTLDYTHYDKVFDKFYDYTEWGRLLGIDHASDLNRVVSQAKIGEYVNLAEAYYDAQLAKIADEIYNSDRKIKLVLLAGPSSSGKTTTSKKLSIYLRSKGFVTHAIELDNYFTDLDKRPLDENGKPDFESVRALDINLFNKQLSQLLEGKKVNLPTFNFVLGKREYKGNTLQLGEKDIIIVEGLHALNDELTLSISKDQKYKIYISPLTYLNVDNHNHIHTSDIRKLRRIVRDSKTRGYGARDTLRMWPTIKAGERENIFKFQNDVDIVVNSSLLYEIGVLKTYVEPLLFNVNEDDPEYPEALRLINFLRNFLPIPSDDVPPDSVLREFIGGSCFKN